MNQLVHAQHMRRAVDLAGNGPDRPFGAVVVDADTGSVVAEGWNRTDLNPLFLDAARPRNRGEGVPRPVDARDGRGRR